MNCENAREQLTDWLGSQLSEAQQAALEAHLQQCPDCAHELNTTRQLWQLMGKLPVPEPSENARVQFHALLDSYKATIEVPTPNWLENFVENFRQLISPLAFRLGYGLALVAMGLLAGYWFRGSDAGQPDMTYQHQIGELSAQVQEMRQMLLLSLLEDPSASQRLRAVSYTNEISQANDQVVEALLMTLNNDPNVNVRLVTVEALVKLAAEPRVREGLVLSLTRQESPLVQVALADAMVKLQEKRSIKPLRKLLQQQQLNELVKSKIQQSIRDLS